MLTRRRFMLLGTSVLGSLLLPTLPLYPAGGDMAMRYHEWKTVCIGRYLIDVPAEAKIETEWSINNNTLYKLDCTLTQMQGMIEKKETELKKEKHETKESMYIRSMPFPDNGPTIIQSWALPNNTSSNKYYIYMPVTTKAGTDVYYLEPEFGLSREEQVFHRYTQVAVSFRALEQGKIPTERGSCMGDVMLLETKSTRSEYGIIAFKLPDAPHLTISIHMFTVQAKPNPLHAGELKKQYGHLDAADPFALRNGPHPVGPLPGYEICAAGVDEDARFRIFLYMWYAPGEVQNNYMPAINFEMSYTRLPHEARGGPRPFTSDAESLAMWDKMVNSIRLRPTEG